MGQYQETQSTQKLLIETREKILTDRESWNDYVLNAAVKFYKYNSYADQMLIYAQRKDTTACTTYDVWNDVFKRYVKRNSNGIALLEIDIGQSARRSLSRWAKVSSNLITKRKISRKKN